MIFQISVFATFTITWSKAMPIGLQSASQLNQTPDPAFPPHPPGLRQRFRFGAGDGSAGRRMLQCDYPPAAGQTAARRPAP